MPKRSSKPQLLFIDTNIWLDFYRSRNETGLQLLKHAEAVCSKIIVSYQLEGEFKRNRQSAILEGLKELKPPQHVPRPGIFSDAASSKILARNVRDAEKRVKDMQARLARALATPHTYDPVYQACQRIFHREDDLVLTHNNPIRHTIRRKAFRRFLHGCPPRKTSDTSIGDAFNWEWMIHCAITRNADLVIVTRDSDYGVTLNTTSYINDHLRQEFGERVSKKGKIQLFAKLSDALKLFDIPITPEEVQAEAELALSPSTSKEAFADSENVKFSDFLAEVLKLFGEIKVSKEMVTLDAVAEEYPYPEASSE